MSGSKRKKRNTRFIPPIIALSAGAIASIMCYVAGYELTKSMFILLVTLFVFALIGTFVRAVVDSFNMELDYSAFFDEDGEIIPK